MEFNGILPLLSYNSGCDYHRILLPFKKMGIEIPNFDGKVVEDFLDETKLIIFNRTPHNMLPQLLKLREKKHFKIVVDIDDYWVLYPHHHMYNSWNKNKIGEKIIESIKIADAVICTTDLLRDKILPLNKNVHIIPNALPFGEYQFTDEKIASERMRFIYAGGSSHFWDLRELTIPMQKINSSHFKNAYQFTLAGYNDINAESKRDWDKIENVFNLKGKLKYYTRANTLPLDFYMAHYNESDVSLIPLESNNFNRFKSNLKIIETGCKFNPVICSRTEPYLNETDKDVVLYANNAREWYAHIKYFIENPSYVKEKGQQLGEHVRKHYDLGKANEYRKQLFDHLIS